MVLPQAGHPQYITAWNWPPCWSTDPSANVNSEMKLNTSVVTSCHSPDSQAVVYDSGIPDSVTGQSMGNSQRIK